MIATNIFNTDKTVQQSTEKYSFKIDDCKIDFNFTIKGKNE